MGLSLWKLVRPVDNTFTARSIHRHTAQIAAIEQFILPHGCGYVGKLAQEKGRYPKAPPNNAIRQRG